MGRSLSFASTTADKIALLSLGFPLAPARKALTKLHTTTRRIIMQKARRHTERIIVLRPLVSVWFQVLLTPLEGVLFIFRSRYFSLSVVKEYLALGDGPPIFRPGST